MLLFVNRQKHETERVTENLEVDGRDATTFCSSIDESGVGVSALPTYCNVSVGMVDMNEPDNDEMQSTVSSHQGSSETFNSQTLSSGDMRSAGLTSTCLTIKLEPSVEDQHNSSPRQENYKRCHDCMTDASRCEQSDYARLNSQPLNFTASYPSVSFSHRCDCPRGQLTNIASSSGNIGVRERQSRRRQWRPGLSRLRRTELRRRSRIVMNVTEDLADDVDGTVNGRRLGVDRTTSSAFNKFNSTACEVGMEPERSGIVIQNATTEIQPTACVTSSVVGTSTTMMSACQSSDNQRRPPETDTDENATYDITHERQVTNRCIPVENKGLIISTEPTNRISTTARSIDVSRMSAVGSKAAPLSIWRALDRDVVPLSSVVNTPVVLPFTPLLQRSLPQSVVIGNGSHAGRSPIVDVPRCYIGSAVKLRRCFGGKVEVEKPRDIVTWMQRRGVALAVPVLRCALTALKYNTVALVKSPVCYIPRHMPIVCPRYRLFCYPPSPCV